MFSILLGALVPLAMWFVVPVGAVEYYSRRLRTGVSLWPERIVSLTVGAMFSLLWCGYVFFVDDRSDFAHWQVVGACLTVIVATAGLVVWSMRRGTGHRIAATLPAVYLSLGICAVFAVIGSASDPTGQWGMGLYVLAICALAGSLLVAVPTAFLAGRTRATQLQ